MEDEKFVLTGGECNVWLDRPEMIAKHSNPHHKINSFNEVNIMKKLTIKILFVLALVVGAVTGSMVLTGVSGQPTVQACEGITPAVKPQS
jgi:hypothetical protein